MIWKSKGKELKWILFFKINLILQLQILIYRTRHISHLFQLKMYTDTLYHPTKNKKTHPSSHTTHQDSNTF